VTVTSLGEELTGVIPLGDMPPVGAIVEVEARGDLLVIPLWFPGPPTTVTVELPAQNVTAVLSGYPPGKIDIVGGPSALFTRGDDTYVRFRIAPGEEGSEPDVAVGYDDTTGEDVMGFDALSVIPSGVTITSIRWLAEGWCAAHTRDPVDNSPGGDFDDNYGLDTTYGPVTTSPLLYIRYGGDPFPSFGGYNLSTFPVGTNGPLELAPGQVSPYSYTYPGDSPARGEYGLGPAIRLVGYPFPYEASDVFLTYLALQVTYAEET